MLKGKGTSPFLFGASMEGLNYSNLGKKINKTINRGIDVGKLELKEVFEKNINLQSPNELKILFIKELKSLLDLENIYEIINHFFETESLVHQACQKFDFKEEDFLFDEFYKNLSPIILKSLADQTSNTENAEVIINILKESMRIAIEEMIYKTELV